MRSVLLAILLFCSCFLGINPSYAQPTVSFGPTTGTSSYFYGPYYRSSTSSSFNYSNYSYLYTASELGIPPGALIIEVAWLKANGTMTGNNTFDIWLENNSATTLSSTTWNNLISGATQVYASTTQSFTAANDAYEVFPISTPFMYSGGSLQITTKHIKTGAASAANNFYYETVTGKAIGYASSTASTGTTTIGSSSSYNNKRPTIRIKYLLQAGNNAGVSELTSPVNFCAGTENIKVKINNVGINVLDSVKVGWSLDGVAQTPINVTTPLDTFGGSGINELEVTLGTHLFTSVPVDLVAWTYLPNGVIDTSTMNDTLTQTLQASLSGTYTINSAVVTGGMNYQSFSDFTADLNTYGICGPVIANVSGGPFMEKVEFGDIAGTSAINTIKINGNGSTVQFTNTSTDRQLLTLNGTKYLSIDSLTFKSLATLYGWGALITNGAEHDSITNCFFDLTSVTSTSSANTNGITFSASNTSATSTGSNGSHCYIGNNHLKWSDGTGGGYYTITMAGSSDSNVVAHNDFENYYMYGTYINGATGTKILNNEYHKDNKTGSLSTFYGIYTTGITPGTEINGNRIHHPGGLNGSSGTFYGLYALGDGTATDPILIANNALYNINQKGLIRGIYLSTSPYNLVYHNTLVFDQTLASSSALYGIYAAGNNTNTEIKNNNVVITGGTTGTKYGFYYSTSSSIDDVQKNNFYVNSTQSGTQYYGYFGSAYASQAAFQAANPSLEAGSPSVDPMFVSASTGDLNVQSAQLIGNGEDLQAIVPTDINGNPRSGAPTIGAFEKPPTGNNNAGVVAFVTPDGTFCTGQQSVSVSITNAGVNNITGLKLDWTVNGVQQPQVSYSGTLVPISSTTGQNIDTVVLGNAMITGGSPTSIVVWTSLPNAVADTITNNDTLTQSFQASMSGTYTINSAVVTGGTNYQSFSDFSSDLNAYGICGPVIANVSGGPFVERVEFGDIAGTSPINTIKINGNGSTIQFTNTSTDRQLLTLNGTKYLSIDSLTFKSLATLYGWGALITGGAAYDSITNCFFDLTSVTSVSSANTNGITFSSSSTSATSTGNNGSHCYIGNNHLKWSDGTGGGYYCLTLVGTSDSNVIAHNVFENFYYYGTYLNGATGSKILNNTYQKENKTGSLYTFYGIYTTGIIPGTEINGNIIHHPGGLTGHNGTFYGIYALGDGTATAPVLIANNAFYHINQNGIIRGIYLSTAPYNLVYHNTLVFDQPLASSSTMYGIYSSGNNTNAEFKNNNVVITAGTTGTKYGFYYSTATSVSDAQKNNFYINSTQSGTQNYGYLASNYATQAAFQTAHPTLEVGSPAVDPMFVNPLIGDFNVQSLLLLGAGVDLSFIVPTDINGNPRPATPTIGAFEQPPTGGNNAGSVAFITPTGNYCPGQQSVSISIENGGINDITNLKIDWTVNGIAQPQISYSDTLVPATSTTGQNMDTVILGNVNLPSGTPTIIKAWTAMPNGVADIINTNDTIELSFQASDFTINAMADSICIGTDAALTLTPNSGYNVGDLQWQTSQNGTTWTDIPSTDAPNYTASSVATNTYYRVKFGNGSSICYSDSLQIAVVAVDTPSVVSAERCGPGTVDLSATGAGGNSLRWFDVATGGSPLATTPNFTTPVLNATTNYWVEAAHLNSIGDAGRNDYPGLSEVIPNNTGQGIRFNALEDINLDSVSVWVTSDTGTVIVQLQDASNTVLSTNTFTFSGSGATSTSRVKIFLPVNYNLPTANNYKILAYPGTTVPLSREGSINPPFGTYGIPNVISLSSSWVNGVANTSNYYYFYNLYVSAGCTSARQMATATIKPQPDIDLGNDTAICSNASFVLDAGNLGSTYLWNDNSTNQTLNVNTAGTYSVLVTGANQCTNTDTIDVAVGIAPINNLPAITNLCSGDSATLDAGNVGSTYLWSNAAITQTINVNSGGTYDVVITSPDACELTTSTTVMMRPLPVVILGADTAVCPNDQIVLDAGNPGMSYLWNTGISTQTEMASMPGDYYVTVTSIYDCQASDTITITNLPSPTSDGFDFIPLFNEQLGKVKFFAINPQNVTGYDWDFGDGTAHATIASPIHTYPSTGIYTATLTVTNECGAQSSSLTLNVQTLGITKIDGKIDFSLYPNPTRNELILENKSVNILMKRISIFNVLGSVVYERNTDMDKTQVLDVSKLASGVYTIRILTNKGLVIKKFEVLK